MASFAVVEPDSASEELVSRRAWAQPAYPRLGMAKLKSYVQRVFVVGVESFVCLKQRGETVTVESCIQKMCS